MMNACKVLSALIALYFKALCKSSSISNGNVLQRFRSALLMVTEVTLLTQVSQEHPTQTAQHGVTVRHSPPMRLRPSKRARMARMGSRLGSFIVSTHPRPASSPALPHRAPYRAQVHAKVIGDLLVAVTSARPRGTHCYIAGSVCCGDFSQRRRRRSPLPARNVQIIAARLPPRLHARHKTIIAKEHLPVQMSPDRAIAGGRGYPSPCANATMKDPSML